MSAQIFDSETNDKNEPEIIEAAWVNVHFGNPTTVDEVQTVMLQPSRPITLGAMATHHIMAMARLDELLAYEFKAS